MGTEAINASGLPSVSIPPPMSPREYEAWQGYILQRCGLYFAESRLRFLRQRLWERMRVVGSQSYEEYYQYVALNPNGAHEWAQILERLLNHETGFFRHMPSFEALIRLVLPELMKEKRRRGISQIALWSAGCSTGQEAYSLAMSLVDWLAASAYGVVASSSVDRKEAGLQVEIIGTDINPSALDKARRGQYKPDQVRSMPERYRKRYLTASKGGNEGTGYQVVGSVRALTQFGYLNLCDPPSYWVTAQDVVFCQNVLLYFKPEKRIEVVEQFCERLNPGGYLFLAPAEVFGLKLPKMQLVREPDALIFQRRT